MQKFELFVKLFPTKTALSTPHFQGNQINQKSTKISVSPEFFVEVKYD